MELFGRSQHEHFNFSRSSSVFFILTSKWNSQWLNDSFQASGRNTHHPIPNRPDLLLCRLSDISIALLISKNTKLHIYNKHKTMLWFDLVMKVQTQFSAQDTTSLYGLFWRQNNEKFQNFKKLPEVKKSWKWSLGILETPQKLFLDTRKNMTS